MTQYGKERKKRKILFFRYRAIIHRIFRESDAAARLLFTIGNEVVTKISQHALAVAIDQLFLKGRPRECVEDLEKFCRRAVQRCVATYFQVTQINVYIFSTTGEIKTFQITDHEVADNGAKRPNSFGQLPRVGFTFRTRN